jgi:hypothetical protein
MLFDTDTKVNFDATLFVWANYDNNFVRDIVATFNWNSNHIPRAGELIYFSKDGDMRTAKVVDVVYFIGGENNNNMRTISYVGENPSCHIRAQLLS